MKKIKVIDIINVNDVFNGVILAGAPIEDVKAIVRFRRETKPTVDGWNDLIKDTIEKLKPADGDTISVEALNAQLNEVLKDEAIREVDITPFEISEAGEEIILLQSKVSIAKLDYIREILKE